MFGYIPIQAAVVARCTLGDVDTCYASRRLKLAVFLPRDREVAGYEEEFIVGSL
jgi:hypothetical protein